MSAQPEALLCAEALEAARDDPMWADHAEITKEACAKSAAELRRLAAVEAQRDALLVALIRCRNRFFPSDQPERDRDELWEPVNAAIKAVEENK